MMDVNAEADRRKKRVEKYFRRTPDPKQRTPAITLVGAAAAAGVLLAIIMFASGSGFLGLLLLAASGYGGYKGLQRMAGYNREYAEAEPKPSDEEMDYLLGRDLAGGREQAMRRLGLTLDELELPSEQWDPVAHLTRGNPLVDQQHQQLRDLMIVYGPAFPTLSAVGGDGVWRFAAYEVMVICPTGYHLGYIGLGSTFSLAVSSAKRRRSTTIMTSWRSRRVLLPIKKSSPWT